MFVCVVSGVFFVCVFTNPPADGAPFQESSNVFLLQVLFLLDSLLSAGCLQPPPLSIPPSLHLLTERIVVVASAGR